MPARLSSANQAGSLEPGRDASSPLSAAGFAGRSQAFTASAFGGDDRGEDAISMSPMAIRATRSYGGWSTASGIAHDAQEGPADRLGDYARSI